MGIELVLRNITNQRRTEMFENAKTLLESGRLELAPMSQLRDDLVRIRRIVTANGVSISLPRTPDGRHCDTASSMVLALDCSYYNLGADGEGALSPRPCVTVSGRARSTLHHHRADTNPPPIGDHRGHIEEISMFGFGKKQAPKNPALEPLVGVDDCIADGEEMSFQRRFTFR